MADMPARRLILITAVAAIIATVGWLLWPSKAAPSPPLADATHCAVYRAWYDDWPDQDQHFIRPYSQPDMAWIVRNGERYGPPTSFERDTREHEEFGSLLEEEASDLLAENYIALPMPESFEFDTAGFYEPVTSMVQKRIDHCFDGALHRPGIHAGSFHSLHSKVGPVALTTLSDVGISEDGRHALVWMSQNCGGWCGVGMFVLFENTDGEWRVIGNSWRWIS